jgi:hypothetical protein
VNGTIDDFEFYISANGSTWGNPVTTGSWGGVTGMCMKETFAPVSGRYVRLVALSEINDNPWTSAAEIYVYGMLTVTVPNVVSLSQALAEANIVAAGLAVGTVTTTYSDTVDAGMVISQSPVSGTVVDAGSDVDIVVSLGRAGDLDSDGDVDLVDLSILKSEYLLQENHTESAGLVVIEAEHFADNTPGSGSMAGSAWTQMTGSGSIGDGFMQALPDQGRSINSNLETYSPHLSYPINFSTTGDYYLWIRGMAADSNADTVHYGADGTAFSFDYNSAFVFPVFAGFSWSTQLGSGARPVITIDSPGMYSLDFWMREDGTALDRFALTTDANYNPNSGGEPAESEYQDLTYDLNADGIMNLADYALLANDWLEGVN